MDVELSTLAHKEPSVISNQYPLVSVILPTYNRDVFISRAIESVLSQTYPAFELIVVNDGSTDNTACVLNSYGERINVIHRDNGGVSAARNSGIRCAAGDYIALLDSDDYWLPEKLAEQTAFFQSEPDALICQTEEIWIRNGKRVNPKKRHQKFSGMIFEKSLPLCLVSPSAVMIRKSLFDEVGLFDETLPACEDYDLWLRISWKYPVYLIDTPLIVKCGGHADQLSSIPRLDKYRIQALVKILKQDGLSQSQCNAARTMLEKKCDIYAKGCDKRGRYEESAYYSALPDQMETHQKKSR
jgi:glycosyltransferase involved in cell wall biosynthesis